MSAARVILSEVEGCAAKACAHGSTTLTMTHAHAFASLFVIRISSFVIWDRGLYLYRYALVADFGWGGVVECRLFMDDFAERLTAACGE